MAAQKGMGVAYPPEWGPTPHPYTGIFKCPLLGQGHEGPEPGEPPQTRPGSSPLPAGRPSGWGERGGSGVTASEPSRRLRTLLSKSLRCSPTIRLPEFPTPLNPDSLAQRPTHGPQPPTRGTGPTPRGPPGSRPRPRPAARPGRPLAGADGTPQSPERRGGWSGGVLLTWARRPAALGARRLPRVIASLCRRHRRCFDPLREQSSLLD